MTLERAKELILANGCRYEQPTPMALNIINESIDFLFVIPLFALSDVAEDNFISTITTGRPLKGQSPITGAYQDYSSTLE